MQTKASYRLLKWALLMGTAGSMATACVVTSGDGDDNIFDGGESGSTSTSGKTSTGGTSSTAGKTSTGGTATAGSGGSSTAGTGTSGSGGSAAAYVPGQCGEQAPVPALEPSCAPAASDANQPCKTCLKAQCCAEWGTCYGENPTSACGYGPTEEADGQFDCIQNCYLNGLDAATNLSDLQAECEGKCLNQCEDDSEDMGFITEITLDLSICANDKCLDECFPAE